MATGADADLVQHIVLGNTTANPPMNGKRHPDHTQSTNVWATIRWMLQHCEAAVNVSLPRSTVYNHYLQHCNENELNPVNVAVFGKLIHYVFLGLRSRRLGIRGKSKYYYCGIRLTSGAVFNEMSEDQMETRLLSNNYNTKAIHSS
jgi:regulatory factor X 1/2/3